MLLGGGVVANRRLRETALAQAAAAGVAVRIPPLDLCTDNGAMIALVGALRLAYGAKPGDYAFGVRPRWELASVEPPR